MVKYFQNIVTPKNPRREGGEGGGGAGEGGFCNVTILVCATAGTTFEG